MPICSRNSRARRGLIVSRFSPSMKISPASGVIIPRIHFSSTDFPVPEPPITTMPVPGITSRSTPSSTRLAPNDFFNPRTRIFGSTSVLMA